MSNGSENGAAKHPVFNEIGGLQKSAPKAAEKLGQTVEKYAYPWPVFSHLKYLVQQAEHLFNLPLQFYLLNTSAGKMLFNILNKDSII